MTCLTIDPSQQEDRVLRPRVGDSPFPPYSRGRALTLVSAATLLTLTQSLPDTMGTRIEIYYEQILAKKTALTGVVPAVLALKKPIATTTEEDSGALLGPVLDLEADHKLWRIAENLHSDLQSRLNALNELADREDQRLSLFIDSNLLNEHIGLPWRSALTHLAERLIVNDGSDRSKLAHALHFNAQVLQAYDQKSADAPLWSAIRKLGGLLEPESANLLLDFLRTEDRLQTRQVALQAVQSLATGGPDRLPPKLKERIAELALSYTNPDWLISGETVSIAANAIAAATLAQVSCISTLLERVKALNRPLLERQVHLSIIRSGGNGSPYWHNPSLRS